jgi:hypothetical protein
MALLKSGTQGRHPTSSRSSFQGFKRVGRPVPSSRAPGSLPTHHSGNGEGSDASTSSRARWSSSPTFLRERQQVTEAVADERLLRNTIGHELEHG